MTVFAVIETEYLFVNIAIQMKRFYSDVCSAQHSLEKRPEIFDSLRVNLSSDVLLGMVHNVMHEAIAQLVMAHGVIGVDGSAVLDVVENRILQSLTLDVRNYHCPNLTKITVEHPHHNGFVLKRPQAVHLE